MGGAHPPQEAHPGSLPARGEGAGRSGRRRWRRCTCTRRARSPDRLSLAHGKELRKLRTDLYEESDAYPNYEGRSGASAREIKTALFNAAQNPDYKCLNALAVLEELEAICKDKSVYEFLQQEVVDGYHDHEEFVRAVEAEYLDRVDEEVRESMGLVSEGQYRELVERYV